MGVHNSAVTGRSSLNRETLASQLAGQLTERILRGHYPPGSLLPPEKTLAEEYGVSRPVVREAVRELSGRGLVTVINSVGTQVQPINTQVLQAFFERALHFDPSSWSEIMEVRRVLEARSVALAAQRRTAEDIVILEGLVDDMCSNVHEPERFSSADLNFHLEIGRISGNSFILHLIGSIQEALVFIIRSLHQEVIEGSLSLMCRFHREILQAIIDGDAERAVEVMDNHFANTLERITNFFASSR